MYVSKRMLYVKEKTIKMKINNIQIFYLKREIVYIHTY